MSITLTQAEADALMVMPKKPSTEETYAFPNPGDRLQIALESLDKAEDFLLDVTRSRIDFAKVTYQNRAHVIIVLMRLDLNGPPHRNPDDSVIACPHLHLYREGYGDKWAFSVPPDRYSNLSNMVQTLSDFLTHCNVTDQPPIQTAIF